MENVENLQNTTPVVESDGLDDLFYRVELDEEESEHLAAEPYSYWKSVFRVFIKKPAAIISLSVLAVLLLCIIIIPSVAYEGAFDFNLDIKGGLFMRICWHNALSILKKIKFCLPLISFCK